MQASLSDALVKWYLLCRETKLRSLLSVRNNCTLSNCRLKQDCIPIGCVPPARWPYLPACSVAGGGTWGVYLVGMGGYLVRGGVPGPGGYLVWGVYLVLGGVPGPGGCTWSWGVYLVRGGVLGPRGGAPGPGGCTWSRGVYLVRYSPPVDRITDACKNITLRPTSLRAVITSMCIWGLFERRTKEHKKYSWLSGSVPVDLQTKL